MLKLMTNANVGGGFAKTLTKTEKLCRNTYFCAKILTKRCFSDFSLTAHLELNSISGGNNGSDILAEHAYKGPLLQSIDEINSFVKVGIAAPRPVKVSAVQEETVSMYPDWAVRESLLNAIIHRDYQIGNAPVKFYDYNNIRIEISNPERFVRTGKS